MSTSYKVTVQPTAEPITVQEAKRHLRVDWDDDDEVIAALISRARTYAEAVTHRALATQTIQQVETIERPIGGELSGPVNRGPSWYQYQEQLGANPFGASQFYFDLSAPPVQAAQPIVIETKITAFDPWRVFPQVTNTDGSTNTYVDDSREPARLYFMSPITANFWRVTYKAGYDPATYPIPQDLKQLVIEAMAYFYENREASAPPADYVTRLLAHRVDWL